jgi:hypothetical protein
MICLFLSAALVLTGCNSSKSPKEALQSSMTKSADIKSYSFKGSMKMEDLKIPAQGTDAQSTTALLNMLKSTDVSWTGAYRADPMLMEMTLSLVIKGDMAINLNIPVVMNKEKIWIKIPNIPMFPIPENIKNKFVELDLKKLAEQSGQPIPSIDPGKSQKFTNDVLGIVFKNVDEKQYLSDVKVKDAGLPADADVKQVIQFKLTQDQVEPFVNTVMEKIAPEVIDLLSKNEEYRNMLQLKPADLDQAKKDLDKAKGQDMTKAMADFKKAVKSLDVTANLGIDKNEYPTYTDVHVKTDFDDQGQAGSAAFKLVSQLMDINKDAKFQYPDGPKDVVTMEQFQQEMGGMFGGAAAGSGS